MTSFALLHISDLHFSTEANTALRPHAWLDPKGIDVELVHNYSLWRPHTYDTARATALALQVSSLVEAFDMAVITGDSATTGLPADIDAALEYIADVPRPGVMPRTTRHTLASIRHRAAALADRLLVVPGNHDRYAWEWDELPFFVPGNNVFDTKFAAKKLWMGGRNGVDWRVIEREKNLLLVAADFCLEEDDNGDGTPFGVLGQGRVTDGPLSELRTVTRVGVEAYNPAVVVWCVHFFPMVAPRGLELFDYAELINAAREMGVSAILCGHIHEKVVRRVDSSLLVFSAGSPTALATQDGHKFHLVSLDLGSDERTLKVSVEHFEWDRGRFRRRPVTDSEQLFISKPSAA